MNNRIQAAILAPPESTASTLFGVYDLLASAGRDWQFIVGGEPGEALFEPHIVSRNRESFRTAAGIRVHPDRAYDDCTMPDIVVIPDIFVAPDEDISGRFDDEVRWIRQWYEQGAIIATACTGGAVARRRRPALRLGCNDTLGLYGRDGQAIPAGQRARESAARRHR